MSVLLYLIPISISLSGIGLLAFFWAVKSKQFEDPEGNAARILLDEEEPYQK